MIGVERIGIWLRSRPLAVSMIGGGIAMIIIAVVWALIARPF
jgi:hypothetical protein